MKYLVINLTRMGDIVQTTAVCGSIKQQNPENTIDFLAMKSFTAILKQNPYVDNVLSFDDESIFDNIPDNAIEAYNQIDSVLTVLNENNYDILINCVVSTESSLLSYLINAKTKYGIRFNKHKQQVIGQGFTAFHLANEHNLGDHGLNSVDIFANTANLAASYDNYNLVYSKQAKQHAESFFNQLTTKTVIGFHVGANRSNKAWESYKFKNVISTLLKNPDVSVLLFGGYSEQKLIEEFNQIKSPNFYNLITKFNLDTLLAYLHKLDLFVVNDTGPMHLAASLKVPIINISLGPVSMWETAPYTNNCLVLKANIDCHPCSFAHVCPHLNCHKVITEQALITAINNKLLEKQTEDANQVMVYKGLIDCYGFQHYVPSVKRVISKHELLFEIKRGVWLESLKNIENSKYLNYLWLHYKPKYYNFSIELETLAKLMQIVNKHISDLLIFKKSGKNLDLNLWEAIKKQKTMLYSEAKAFTEIYDYFLYTEFCESGLESSDIKLLLSQTVKIYKNLYSMLYKTSKNLRSFTCG